MTNFLIISENEYSNWQLDEKFFIDITKKIFEYYLTQNEVTDTFCLKDYDFTTISFDILYTDSKKTHEINKEYRNKDYPADIITFAIFADSEDKFVFDREINLGEIIIALDKVIEESVKKGTTKEHELAFLISHGIMHLLGFDHQTEVDYNFVVGLQNKALEYVKI